MRFPTWGKYSINYIYSLWTWENDGRILFSSNNNILIITLYSLLSYLRLFSCHNILSLEFCCQWGSNIPHLTKIFPLCSEKYPNKTFLDFQICPTVNWMKQQLHITEYFLLYVIRTYFTKRTKFANLAYFLENFYIACINPFRAGGRGKWVVPLHIVLYWYLVTDEARVFLKFFCQDFDNYVVLDHTY